MRGDDRAGNVVVMTLRCLIVDDSPRFAAAARSLLERQGVSIVGTASNGADALRLAGKLQPDVVLIDLDLGDESGLELATELSRSAAAAPPVIFISTHAEDDYADLLAESPSVGFLPKTVLSAAAISRLLDGRGTGSPGR
jgi:DNA-binding NarL/FixJ family response regulator